MHATRTTRLRGVAVAIVAFTLGPARAYPLAAQQPAWQQPAVLAPYRGPTLVLVQPHAGAAIPRDRPVILFRFAQGEAGDPIDEESFTVSVDGQDRTHLFKTALNAVSPAASGGVGANQLPSGDAWGVIASRPKKGATDSLAVGPHHVAARVCSSRGICAALETTVIVAPPVVAPRPALRKRSLIEKLLDASQKLVRH